MKKKNVAFVILSELSCFALRMYADLICFLFTPLHVLSITLVDTLKVDKDFVPF